MVLYNILFIRRHKIVPILESKKYLSTILMAGFKIFEINSIYSFLQFGKFKLSKNKNPGNSGALYYFNRLSIRFIYSISVTDISHSFLYLACLQVFENMQCFFYIYIFGQVFMPALTFIA